MEFVIPALLVALGLTIVVGIVCYLRRQPAAERRWHVFYTVFERDDDTYCPLYRVGTDVGTKSGSAPFLIYAAFLDWECVSSVGFDTRDDAIKEAGKLEAEHVAALAALTGSDALRDPDSSIFDPRLAA